MKTLDLNPKVKIHVFPGGVMPQMKSEDGYPDISVRAICSHESDPANSSMRKTLFDFDSEPDESLPLYYAECFPRMQQFRLHSHKEVTLACGFALDYPYEYTAFIKPRGSTIARGLANDWDTVPIDPGFRGEAVASIFNKTASSIYIAKHERLFQLVLLPRIIPVFVSVSFESLSKSARGHKRNGSSGKH